MPESQGSNSITLNVTLNWSDNSERGQSNITYRVKSNTQIGLIITTACQRHCISPAWKSIFINGEQATSACFLYKVMDMGMVDGDDLVISIV